MKLPLHLPYKGSRHYLHGTDIFNAIQKVIQELSWGNGAFINHLVFRHFVYCQCDIWLDEPPDPSACFVGEGQLMLPCGSTKEFFLHEGTEQPAGRKPYDEESMVATAAYSGKSATLNAPIGYTTIEAAVALTKALNYRLAIPKQGKWVFGRIDLKQPLPLITETMTITHTKGVPLRFSVNEIAIDGRFIGTIQFIVGSP